MGQFIRTWGVGITAAAVVAGSVGTAVAVASPSSAPRKPAASSPALASASAKAPMKTVRAWQQFRISGVITNLRPGSKVTLQQKQGKRWTSLPASMRTTNRSTYSMRVMLGMKGHNKLRLVDTHKRAVTPVMHVWVR
ncbi:hypothetical protein QWM81_04460 [Streptomyces ficellus]|uniref:Uncharacterized protein n=1 Tax=Streptomyces ficellus TaxID=1977088 RepID=A0ABT7Z1E3_9ACTN|nr:hypothetical protein [Streptomyces ficellus]MDN3293313.1 hypothetical protein [Streptomyces ficellus]